MPRGAAPGERRGGRAKGKKNKTTIERETRAVAYAASTVDKARAGEIELGRDVLRRLMKVCEGMAAKILPGASEPIVDGAGKFVNRERLTTGGEWIDRVIYCAKACAEYESPKLRGVLVAMDTAPAAPEVPFDDPEKMIDAIAQRDPNQAGRLYHELTLAFPQQVE